MYHSVIAGVIQGVLEWLPVSSEGSVAIYLYKATNLTTEHILDFTISLHLGTLLAAIIYFRVDIIKLLIRLPAFIKTILLKHKIKRESPEDRLLRFILFSVFFTVLTGLPIYVKLYHIIGGTYVVNYFMFFIGFFLVATGFMERQTPGTRRMIDATSIDATLYGLIQGLSVIPGISRSGITMFLLLSRKFRQEDALKLSFIAGIPSIAGAQLFLAIKSFHFDIVAILSAFITGYLSIGILLSVAEKINFSNFCILYGFITMIFGIM